ncbi:unnamed protein product [Porites evermanni]|uniref:Uncharacterized protein n=1 Tax=Porites evermanni TaxID=104178 RepID=A0ABN8LM44_9CNID|nr:unnamed protein product [Porites evermanni]
MDTPSFFMRQSDKETSSTYFHKFVSGMDETGDPWYKTSSKAKLYQFSNQPVETNRVKGLQKVQEPKSEVFIRENTIVSTVMVLQQTTQLMIMSWWKFL